MKLKILIAESNYSSKALAIYKKLGSIYFLENLSSKEKNKIFPQINILVVRLGLTVSGELMAKMSNLKIIATSTTGLNHIDTKYAKAKGVKIISLRGQKSFLKNIPSTAELTFGLIISLLRNIPAAFDDVKLGGWNSSSWSGHQLLGKSVGLLGFGRLGKIMARYAKAFNMKVMACDPNVSEKFMKSRGVVKINMDGLFKRSDIVSLHVLLTDQTQNLIKEKHLRSMKPSAYLINTARAELIEKNVLYNALKNKRIAGAGIDVMWDERSDGSHLKKDQLWKYTKTHQNLIIAPHIGGATYEAMAVTQDFIAESVFNFLKK
ncbi:MAG: NAD(P)-dependent oxidoreductase [Patescibacteria group bacterium]